MRPGASCRAPPRGRPPAPRCPCRPGWPARASGTAACAGRRRRRRRGCRAARASSCTLAPRGHMSAASMLICHASNRRTGPCRARRADDQGPGNRRTCAQVVRGRARHRRRALRRGLCCARRVPVAAVALRARARLAAPGGLHARVCAAAPSARRRRTARRAGKDSAPCSRRARVRGWRAPSRPMASSSVDMAPPPPGSEPARAGRRAAAVALDAPLGGGGGR